LEVIEEALKTYNIAYWMRLSLRDDVNKEKYLGEDSVWEESEGILKKLLQEKKIDHKEVTGEAAFYGPKVDIMAVDALDREWQISTVQLDFSQPERFDLNCINEKGEKERVVMIHRALIGSPDRFLGILIEHYAGAFPLWLSPEQVRVLPVAVAHTEFAQGVVDQLKTAGIRAEIDDTNESLGKKIRSAKQDKLPYFAVVGDKEASSNTIALEKHNGDKVEGSVEELIEKLVTEIKNRTID